MNKPLIIGVAGGTASGKTSVSRILYDAFSDRTITLLRQDDYYNDQSHMTMEERVKTNYDHPLSMDNELLVKHLKKLILGYSIEKPIYDYTHHTRSEETEKIEHTINYDTLEKINTLIDFFSNNEDVYSLLINFRKNREC